VIVNKSRPCGLRDELRQLAIAFFEVSTIVIASGGFRSSHPQRESGV
jgi:hypothetical protein